MIQLFLSLLTFLFLLPLQNTTHKLQIGLIVDENVPEEIIKFAKKEVSDYYFSKISIIEGFEFPEEYRADTINVNKLINRYENKMPGNCDKYIFLTNKSIALNDNANYSVRGLAKRQGKLKGLDYNKIITVQWIEPNNQITRTREMIIPAYHGSIYDYRYKNGRAEGIWTFKVIDDNKEYKTNFTID